MGNPPFKPSEGDRLEILRVGQHITCSEVQQVSGVEVLIRLKVRPEAEQVTHVRFVGFFATLQLTRSGTVGWGNI